jgi:hypothetical protein
MKIGLNVTGLQRGISSPEERSPTTTSPITQGRPLGTVPDLRSRSQGSATQPPRGEPSGPETKGRPAWMQRIGNGVFPSRDRGGDALPSLLQASALPPDLKQEVAHAIQKAGIPLRQETIKDIERFNDSTLQRPMEPMTPGNLSAVSKATYPCFVGVFKRPARTMMSMGLRAIEHSNSLCREKATHLLDEQLRFGAIPPTSFAAHRDADGRLQVGVVMEFVQGASPVTSRREVDVSDSETGRKLLQNRKALASDSALMKVQCKLLGVESIAFSGEDRVEICHLQSPVKLDSPEVKRDLVALQILDFICGQVDRHSKNYIVSKPGTTTGRLGAKGIDNDLAFDRGFAVINFINRAILHRPINLGLPEVIDSEMLASLRALKEADLRQDLADFLPPSDIDALVRRMETAKSHFAAHPGSVIAPNEWNSVHLSDATKSYISRDSVKLQSQWLDEA